VLIHGSSVLGGNGGRLVKVVSAPRGRIAIRSIVAATLTATLATLPVFLTGATAVTLRQDLGFSTGGLGVAVATFWVSMALMGAPGGRLAQRVGATSSIRLGAVAAAVSLLGASTAGNLTQLCLWLVLAGLASGFCQPAADLTIAVGVPVPRLGLAFGVKQSSVPGAAMLAGLAVPSLALTVGWRWAFIASALLVVPVLFVVPLLGAGYVGPARVDAREHQAKRLTRVWLLAGTVSLAMAAVSAMGAFYVESAVAYGQNVEAAGVMLAVGSAFGVAGRFFFAWRLADVPRPFFVTAGLVALGGMATLVFSLGVTDGPLVAATAFAFGAGWGWNGLFTHAVVTTNSDVAARASGIIVVGAAGGGVFGPLVFGFATERAGFGLAWILAGVFMLVAAGLMALCSRSWVT